MEQNDKIIQFPRERVSVSAAPIESKKSLLVVLWEMTVAIVWILVFFAWRIVRWPYAIFCAFQFLRMLINWSTPGVHAGWTFLGYFAVLCFFENLPLIYRPKAFDNK
jgi:hypothetical protein